MASPSIRPQRNKILRSVLWQFIVMVSLATCIALYRFEYGYSFLLGGAVFIFANLIFINRFFSSGNARDAKRIIRSLWFAEFLKLGISAILCVTIIITLKITILAFLLGYIVASQVSWLLSFATISNGASA